MPRRLDAIPPFPLVRRESPVGLAPGRSLLALASQLVLELLGEDRRDRIESIRGVLADAPLPAARLPGEGVGIEDALILLEPVPGSELDLKTRQLDIRDDLTE